MSINFVSLSGNLTRDPELKTTSGTTSVISWGMAVNDRRRNPQTGEWEDVPNFVDCALFGSRAEPLSRVLHKGSKVFVSGKLKYSTWERDGHKRSKLEVIVSDLDILAPPKVMDAQTAMQAAQPQQPYQPQPQQTYQQYQPQPQQHYQQQGAPIHY